MPRLLLSNCPSSSPLNLRIEATFGSSDCDDCGGYDWSSANITVGDDELVAYHDGHLGGGNWSGELTDLYLWALAMAGIQVEVRLPDGSVDQVLDVPHFEEDGPSSLPRAVRDFAAKAPLRLAPITLLVPLAELDDWAFAVEGGKRDPLVDALEGLLRANASVELEFHRHVDKPTSYDEDSDVDSEGD